MNLSLTHKHGTKNLQGFVHPWFLWRKHGTSTQQNGQYGESAKTDHSYEDFMVKSVLKSSRDSMERDTFNGVFMVKLVRRFSGNFIHRVFPWKLQTNHITPTNYEDNIIFPVICQDELFRVNSYQTMGIGYMI